MSAQRLPVNLKFRGPDQVARRAKEVNTTLTSSIEMDFVGLFHLRELYYDGFC